MCNSFNKYYVFKHFINALNFISPDQALRYKLVCVIKIHNTEVCLLCVMEFKTMLRLQKCLYFNFYLFLIWFGVVGFFLYAKLNSLGHLTKYLSLTVYTLLIIIESPRIYLGHYGNLSCRVPELAGFLMLTVLMQMPLVSFFLFNPYLLSTPMEVTLHAMLWLLTLIEVVFSFMTLKQASDIAKSIYLSQTISR